MNALTVSIPQSAAISIDPAITGRKEAAISAAESIFGVSDKKDQAQAVETIQSIKRILKDVEASRKAVKAELEKPITLLDQTAKDFVAPLKVECERLEKAVNEFTAEEIRKANEARRQAEEAARKARDEEERKRREAEEAARKAKEVELDFSTKAEVETAQKQAEEAARQAEEAKKVAAAPAPVIREPEKPQGMAGGERPVFEVIDLHALYKANPALVRLEANKLEINRLLSEGVRQIPGLKIWMEFRSSFKS